MIKDNFLWGCGMERLGSSTQNILEYLSDFDSITPN